MSSRFLVRQGSQTVIIIQTGRLGGNAKEPSPVAVAQCTLIVNLIVGAVWLGLWLGYGKAENCDKKLQLWYDLVLGGMAFGLACDVGVVIAARKESKPALKLCNVLIKLDISSSLASIYGASIWRMARRATGSAPAGARCSRRCKRSRRRRYSCLPPWRCA